MGCELLGRLNPQQPDSQTDIPEIKLGGFDDTLPIVPVMGGKAEGNVGCFQNRDPVADRAVGDPAVVSDAVGVEELTDISGAEGEKALEQRGVLNVDDLSDIC